MNREIEDTDAAAPPRTNGKPVDPRLLRYASASRGFFVVIGAIAAAQTAVVIAFAWLLTRAVTGVIDGAPVSELTTALVGIAAVVALRAALLWLREVVAIRAAARVQSQLRTALVGAVGSLGPGWLDTRNSAALAVTAGRGLDALEAYFGRYLPQLVQTVIATPIIIIVMWWADWISGLTVLLTIPLIPIFMVLIGLATQAVQRRQWETLQQLAARFADTVQGLSTLKVFGRQHRAVASIERVTNDYRRETMRVLRISFLSGFALEFLASISVAIIAVTIGFRLLDGSLTLLVGLFVLLLAPEAYLPLRQVGVQFHAAAEGVAATDDIFEVLDAARLRRTPASPGRSQATGSAEPARGGGERSPARTADATTLARASGTVRNAGDDTDAPSPAASRTALLHVADLRVRRGERLLAPVSFDAATGTITLVEGPSGTGKSSLFAALRGAADFDGEATYRGIGVDTIAPSAWLAWAGQQPGLLTGTVAENIVLGDDAPDGLLVTRALTLACADEIAPELRLGVQGAGVSGGQAQRIAVARAFYRRLRGHAAVVALDEPSSALDPETEERLWRGVRMLADDGAAVLLISHRTSARAIADHVVRLEPIEVDA